MSANLLGIYNRALQDLGAKRLSSPDEDSVNGRACRACYEDCRDSLLREHRWVFAIKRASLAADEATPDWGKDYAYSLPSDYIQTAPKYPEDASNSSDWEFENGKIYSDESAPLYLRYIGRITDVPKMDSLFRMALSSRMAYHMAEELTQSNSKKTAAAEAEDAYVKKAKRANAIEKLPTTAADGSWITERD